MTEREPKKEYAAESLTCKYSFRKGKSIFLFRPPLVDRRKIRINKYEKGRRAKTRFQKDGPNADQREKEREDHVAHQDRTSTPCPFPR